jgi:hypothetical protein
MLSVLYGLMAMAPITFGVAGYVLVSRKGPVPYSTVQPKHLDKPTD